MFKITPIQDKETQKKYIEACGGKFREDFFAYEMTDAESGELMGVTQFEILGEYGYISDILEPAGRSDFEAMFILGRATMNFIDLSGAHKCKAAMKAGSETLLRSIGFLELGGEYFCDMTGMFDGNCKGHSK